MEVEDLRLLAVVAVGWSWRQPEPGNAGVGGSSRDKVRTAQYCRMGRVWWTRREGIREEPVLLRLLKFDQLESGGCGLGGGAHLSSWAAGHVVGMAGNCRAGFAGRARQVV